MTLPTNQHAAAYTSVLAARVGAVLRRHYITKAIGAFVTIGSLVLAYYSIPQSSGRLSILQRSQYDLAELTTLIAELHKLPIELAWIDRVGMESPTRKPLSRLHICSIEIENVGELGIDFQHDVAAPISFALDGDGEILLAARSVRIKQPSFMASEITLATDRRNFEWSTQYMPPGGKFVFDVVHTGSANALVAHGRLVRQEPLSLMRPNDTHQRQDASIYLAFRNQTLATAFVLSVLFFLLRRRFVDESTLRSLGRSYITTFGISLATLLVYGMPAAYSATQYNSLFLWLFALQPLIILCALLSFLLWHSGVWRQFSDAVAATKFSTSQKRLVGEWATGGVAPMRGNNRATEDGL